MNNERTSQQNISSFLFLVGCIAGSQQCFFVQNKESVEETIKLIISLVLAKRG